MSKLLMVVGFLVDGLGIVWILQGLNVLGGSPMTGDPFWVGAGIALSCLGMGLVAVGVVLQRTFRL
jgi:hypothetical protein